jgi:hypothetical protein
MVQRHAGGADDHWMQMAGGHAGADVTDAAIYLAISVRNVGQGYAVLNAWRFSPDRSLGPADRPDPAEFHRLTRDLYHSGGR